MRILIADDQPKLVRNMQRVLQMDSLYTVDVAFDGDEALQKALANEYDCIVLDVMMPGQTGFEVCTGIRSAGNQTPVLLLTSLSDKKNTVTGLDSGADDYLTKPFDMDELMARIRALLRRVGGDHNPVLSANGVSLDPKSKTVTYNDETIDLAPKELSLLEFLLRNKGEVQSRTDIIQHVWGESEESLFSQTLDVHIAYLRKKMSKEAIKTVTGFGYMIPTD